jgi:hypothetical protein
MNGAAETGHRDVELAILGTLLPFFVIVVAAKIRRDRSRLRAPDHPG